MGGRSGFYDRALSRHSVRLASHIKIKAEEQNKFSNNTSPSSKTEVCLMKSYFDDGVGVSKLPSQDPPKLSTEGIEPLAEESIPRENLFKKLLLNLMPILFILTGLSLIHI